MGSKKVKVGEGSALAGANEAPLHFPGSQCTSQLHYSSCTLQSTQT